MYVGDIRNLLIEYKKELSARQKVLSDTYHDLPYSDDVSFWATPEARERVEIQREHRSNISRIADIQAYLNKYPK